MDTEWGSVGPGWDKLVQPLIDMCKEKGVEIQQIKEKFGTLRFHVNVIDIELGLAIHEAENRSAVTCEECGAEGQTASSGGWLRTLCDLHGDDFNAWAAKVREDAGVDK